MSPRVSAACSKERSISSRSIMDPSRQVKTPAPGWVRGRAPLPDDGQGAGLDDAADLATHLAAGLQAKLGNGLEELLHGDAQFTSRQVDTQAMVGAGGEGHMGRVAVEDHLVGIVVG